MVMPTRKEAPPSHLWREVRVDLEGRIIMFHGLALC